LPPNILYLAIAFQGGNPSMSDCRTHWAGESIFQTKMQQYYFTLNRPQNQYLNFFNFQLACYLVRNFYFRTGNI